MNLLLVDKAERVLHLARSHGVRIAVAESCTGGLISSLFTEIPGSSDVFERGFVTYSNLSKTQMLGVEAALIDTHGAVSEHVARAMAEGAITHSAADLAVSVTGIAGPGGGTPEKPVGTVHIAVAKKGEMTSHRKCTFDAAASRKDIRLQSVSVALDILLERLETQVT